MSLLLANRAVFGISTEEKILITVTPTAGFTVGFKLNFTGSVDVDFKDGGGKEALTSGIEKTHLYSIGGTYITEITGDIGSITFFDADNSKISFMSNLNTSLLTRFDIINNLYVGKLDLSLSPVKTFVAYSDNAGLDEVEHAASGNELVLQYDCFDCDIQGNLDLSNIPLTTRLLGRGNPDMTSVLLSATGNGTLSLCHLYNCGILSQNFSTIGIGGGFRIYNNPSCDTLIFRVTGNATLTEFLAYNCDLPDVDFSVFPTSNGVTIRLDGNSMSATEHDDQLINLNTTGWINGSLAITSGNTARTSASDTAYNNLTITNGWTIT